MIFLFDFTLLVIDIHHIMLISLFPAPFDHFHFHPTLGLDPALILALRLKAMVNFFLIFLNCQRLNMAEQYPSGLPLGCRNDEAIKDPQDNLKTFHVIHYPSNFRHAIKVIMAHMKHF